MDFPVERYQLRYAAGRYWLLDMKPREGGYKRPWCLNETGALIFRLLAEDGSVERAAGELAGRYQISEEQAAEDIRDFLSML